MPLREQVSFELKDVDNITPQQRARRTAWLKGDIRNVGRKPPVIRTVLMLAFWAVALPMCGGAVLSLDISHWRYSLFVSRGHVVGLERGRRLPGSRYKTVGLDQLDPQRNYVFMSNHVSNIDPPIMVPLIPRRTSVMVKKELFNYPLLGKTMRLGSLIPVDRGNREAGIAAVRSAAAVSASGHQHDYLCRRPSFV